MSAAPEPRCPACNWPTPCPADSSEHCAHPDFTPGLVVTNPEAIGDPDATPVVYVPKHLHALFRVCVCGGVNGFHEDDCEARNV